MRIRIKIKCLLLSRNLNRYIAIVPSFLPADEFLKPYSYENNRLCPVCGTKIREHLVRNSFAGIRTSQGDESLESVRVVSHNLLFYKFG